MTSDDRRNQDTAYPSLRLAISSSLPRNNTIANANDLASKISELINRHRTNDLLLTMTIASMNLNNCLALTLISIRPDNAWREHADTHGHVRSLRVRHHDASQGIRHYRQFLPIRMIDTNAVARMVFTNNATSLLAYNSSVFAAATHTPTHL